MSPVGFEMSAYSLQSMQVAWCACSSVVVILFSLVTLMASLALRGLIAQTTQAHAGCAT